MDILDVIIFGSGVAVGFIPFSIYKLVLRVKLAIALRRMGRVQTNASGERLDRIAPGMIPHVMTDSIVGKAIRSGMTPIVRPQVKSHFNDDMVDAPFVPRAWAGRRKVLSKPYVPEPM